ncbi:hypothetical protein CANTEDRAFT_127942 [Yamadazyma tenuis ATCC 10573]|uniref:BRO1 domain-containing protein n=1 Tax=Candida tenuis (strain ATCC 10573 / BCRC 21748 / CBS 615 / JCM 9827 / NBRC 10315 / NRRL Y-1498 / VKM Y-70) TaxID=590646 RepID=G3BER4_CANTC|nr:uncharacterized protein CANTEDRAFT_127942 [Yamadazyma tenuis ATCC 10573]EGV60573.1 hypothetical protein CANTEDRAFT_127942 [Yamadazyma tenuis ATCC 10573]
MASNLLYIPFRKTKELNLGDELKAVIKRDYFQSPSVFENDLSQLTKIRKKIRHLKDEAVDKSTEIIVQHYYIQVVNLTKKFADEVIEFVWYGTLGYKPSGPYKVRSLSFEQDNIVYQLGSLYSQLGWKESRFTDEGLKRSCNYFQMAAGCFEYLCVQCQKDYNTKSNDLSVDTLQHLKYIMLSQGQESIWQKAVNSDMKNSVISKLSMDTSNLYKQAVEHGNKSDFIKLEYVNYCSVKQFHFAAAAHYRMSLISLDNSKYGQQVGHLKIAAELAHTGMRHKSYVKNLVVEDLGGLQKMIEDALRVAERENDLIYLRPVPELSSLRMNAGGVSMVKPVIIEELSEPLNSDRLFLKELLPHIIIQISLAYKDRSDNFIMRKILEPLQALNKMMNHFLTQRQLPASIDSIQKPENIPESIIQHSQNIISFGGTKFIESLYDNILQLSSECRDIYEGCQQRLVIEQEEDDIFRERFGGSWNRISSEEASRELWAKVHSMEEYLTQADKADDIILMSYHEIKEYLEIYCGGYDSLTKVIPNAGYTKLDDDTSIIVNDIRVALNATAEMEESRKDFLKRLENKSRDNNILPKLIAEYRARSSSPEFVNNLDETSFEGAFHQHMKVFNEDLQFVELSKNTQMVLEKKIDELNSRFLEVYKDTESNPNHERKHSLQALENIYSRYLQLITNINEARKFYTDFKTRGHRVIGECDEYLQSRRAEARDFEDIQTRDDQSRTQPGGSRVVTPVPVVAARARSP